MNAARKPTTGAIPAAMGTASHCRQPRRVVHATAESALHFTESGLPNVYLSGIAYCACPACGNVAVDVPARDEMMSAIGRALVLKSTVLSGAEIRFLRHQIKLQAIQFAKLLYVTPQHFSRWENSKSVPAGCTDRMIRLTYAFLSDDQELQRRLQREFADWTASIRPVHAQEHILAEYAGKRWEARMVRDQRPTTRPA